MTDKKSRSIRYKEDFKLQAAKLIVEGGYTYASASRKLGVSSCALRNWTKAFRASGHLAPEGTVVPQAAFISLMCSWQRFIAAAICLPLVKRVSASFSRDLLITLLAQLGKSER